MSPSYDFDSRTKRRCIVEKKSKTIEMVTNPKEVLIRRNIPNTRTTKAACKLKAYILNRAGNKSFPFFMEHPIHITKLVAPNFKSEGKSFKPLDTLFKSSNPTVKARQYIMDNNEILAACRRCRLFDEKGGVAWV